MRGTPVSCRARPTRRTRTGSTTPFIFVAIFTGVIFVAVEGALIAFIIKYRRGKPAAHRRRPADPRRDAARDHLDGRSRPDPRGDRDVRLLQAARASRRAESAAADETTVIGRGPPVLLAVPVPERRDLDRPHGRARRPGRARERRSACRFDVNHSWWVPDFGGEARRDPRPREQDVVQGARRQLRRALRRALRHPARAHGRRRARRAARAVRRVHRGTRERRPGGDRPRQGGVDRASASSCHRLDHAYIGPALGGNPLLCRPRRGSRRCSGTARGRCRRSARTGPTRRSTR